MFFFLKITYFSGYCQLENLNFSLMVNTCTPDFICFIVILPILFIQFFVHFPEKKVSPQGLPDKFSCQWQLGKLNLPLLGCFLFLDKKFVFFCPRHVVSVLFKYCFSFYLLTCWQLQMVKLCTACTKLINEISCTSCTLPLFLPQGSLEYLIS